MLIIFLGIPCTFLYNILAALIRSLGDSKTPVIFLALASVLNIGLDLVFIIVFRMGVQRSCTCDCAGTGNLRVVLSVVYWKAFSNPAGNERRVETVAKVYDTFMCGWNSDGNAVFDHSDRNTCDPGSSERFWLYSGGRVTAATKLGNFVSCPIEALGQTMAPYVGQNMGAGKPKRIGKGLLAASVMGFGVSAVLFVIVLLFESR